MKTPLFFKLRNLVSMQNFDALFKSHSHFKMLDHVVNDFFPKNNCFLIIQKMEK